MMGFSVMLFLKKTDNVKDYYFNQYIFSQSAFWLGFFISNNKNIKINLSKSDNKPLIATDKYFYLYLFVATAVICTNFVIWYVSGIPIFQSSRLNAVAVGGGFGFLLRFLDIYTPVCIYLSYYFMLSANKNYRYVIFSGIIFSLQIIISFLSGSKSAILGFVSVLFLFSILNKENFGKMIKKINKYQFLLLLIPLCGALLTIMVSSSNDIQTAIYALLFRLVSFGDVYYQAYPSGAVEELTRANIFTVLFGDLLRIFRIIPLEQAPPVIGFELTKIVNGIDTMTGANARHNVYGYVHFGVIGSLFFSFACGLVLNIVRLMFFKVKNIPQDKKVMALLLYLSVLKVEADPPAFINFFNNIILLFPLFIIMNTFISISRKKDKSLNSNIIVNYRSINLRNEMG
jgi:oligosaccharide repeat unit polymerase